MSLGWWSRRPATVLLTLILVGCAGSSSGRRATTTVLPAERPDIEWVATSSPDQSDEGSDAVVVVSSIVGLALGAALLVWVFGKLGG
jgi:hypothetical protein